MTILWTVTIMYLLNRQNIQYDVHKQLPPKASDAHYRIIIPHGLGWISIRRATQFQPQSNFPLCCTDHIVTKVNWICSICKTDSEISLGNSIRW